MPWIENVAAADIPTRFHHEAGENSMLISIVDPASWRPTPAHTFKEIHNFEFLDVEKNDHVDDEAMKCSQEQANELVRLLQHALENKMKKKYLIVGDNNFWYATTEKISKWELEDELEEFSKEYTITELDDLSDEAYLTVRIDLPCINVDYIIESKIRELLLSLLIHHGKFVRVSVYY